MGGVTRANDDNAEVPASTPPATEPDSGDPKGPESSAGTKKAESILDNPEQDRVDRSIIVGTWLKQVSMWALRVLIITITAWALWRLIGQFWVGILPVILALIVCTVLAPPTSWMRRHGVPSALASIISILGFFGIVGGIVAVIAPDVVRQSQVLYLQALEGIQRLQLWAQGPPLELNSQDLDQVVNDIVGWVQNQAGDIAGGVVTGLSTATSLIINLFMVLVLTVFFLKDGHRFLPWLRRVMGQRTGWHTTEVLTRSWETLGGYIRAQATVSAIDAIFIGIGLWLIGVPMAFTLSVFTFIAGFIPYVGAVTAGAVAVLVALVSLGFTEALLVLILIILVQQLEGNILSPILQSRAMNLHPVIVLVSVVVGGGLFDLVGAFLAVPVAAVVAVVLRYLLDMTALHAGERDAEDIEYITPEGFAVGRLGERQGRIMRQRWREEQGQYNADDEYLSEHEQPLPDDEPRDDEKHSRPRAGIVQAGSQLFDLAFERFRRS